MAAMLGRVPVSSEDEVVMKRGSLTVEVSLRPFSVTVSRRGRPLLRSSDAWSAMGTAADQFVALTEGVIASEAIALVERVALAVPRSIEVDRVELDLRMDGDRRGRLTVALPAADRVLLELDVEGGALRLGIDWEAHPGERFVGLGARHGTQLDQARRNVQLGADRRYTGPDLPAELLAQGGIPQGDCAPAPWVISSRGYAIWAETHGNGTRFEMGDERVAVSARARAGPLRLHVIAAGTPARCLRTYCRLTGFPPVLPEWGYGFWKSRDVYEHQDDVEDDFQGFERHGIPLDAIVLDSPWETQYNTWEFNPHQFPDAAGLIARLRAAGVRTVVWVTPWVNLDSRDGQVPPDPDSQRLHRQPAATYAPAAAAGHFVRSPDGQPHVARWWMGTGSPVDFTSPTAERWWRDSAKRVLALGVQGIKADDGEGYYFPDDVRFADGRTGAQAAWAYGGLYRRSMQRALDEVHPEQGVLFGRSGWSGQQATGMLWAGDQASDFWSLRALVAATLAGACSAMSNWSHDVGGYLGHRLMDRCPPELLVRWAQFGCFTPLMHAHGRLPQEPWTYGQEILDVYRAYVLLHERLVPYVRAAASTASRTGIPIVRPLCLTDSGDVRGWSVADAYGYGPALWVAPVVEQGARERETILPRGRWIESWSGREVLGGGEVLVSAPLPATPVWVRAGSIVVTLPAEHIAAGLGHGPEWARPLEATLWGEPHGGRATARLCDGTRVDWRRGSWSVRSELPREVRFRQIAA